MSEVALTGGSGFVGGPLLASLVEAGTPVRAIVRSADAARTVESRGGRPVVADLFERHADLLNAHPVVGGAQLRSINDALGQVERFWSDQIRYIY